MSVSAVPWLLALVGLAIPLVGSGFVVWPLVVLWLAVLALGWILFRRARFNLRYDGGVPRGITPREVMAALASYVNFPGSTADDRRVDDSVPRKGMMRAEAESTLGSPVASSEHQEGSLKVVTLVFNRRNERITADFVEDVLVRYVTTPR